MIIKSDKELEKIHASFSSSLEEFYKKRTDPSYIMLDSDYADLAKCLSEYFSALFIDTDWFDYISQITSEILYRPVYLQAILEGPWTKLKAKEFALTNFIISNEQISFNDEIKKDS